MRALVACIALAIGFLLVGAGVGAAPAPRLASEPARLTRLLPHAALLSFRDGAFTVVPRSALPQRSELGDLLDLRHRPPGDRRLALASGSTWLR